jgi:RNA polymerase sigma factor (TIGR02999 family)
MSEAAALATKAGQGDRKAAAELLNLVYGELHRLAIARMAREPAGQTLQPTALVHEAWLRLGGDQQPTWQNEAHFFGAAAEAMRRILIDRARRKNAARRGGGHTHVPIDDLELGAPWDDERLLAIDEALALFAQAEPKKAEFVRLRYFAGLQLDETARVLGISEATGKRWWLFARAWLYRKLNPDV